MTTVKICCQCKNEKLYSLFARDRNKPLGLDKTCKACRKQYRLNNKDKELARWKKSYAPGTLQRTKHVIRSLTRAKHGSAKNHICFCGNAAEEWHHIEYKVDSVIAVCAECHHKVAV